MTANSSNSKIGEQKSRYGLLEIHGLGSLKSRRNELLEKIPQLLRNQGFLGLEEGYISAADMGLVEMDAAEVPPDRDWVMEYGLVSAQCWQIYFDCVQSACSAKKMINQHFPELQVSDAKDLPQQDWNAEWKKHFQGVANVPLYEIYPPWVLDERSFHPETQIALMVNPGAGFGTGSHETTQLCLEVMIENRKDFLGSDFTMLDFGAGSGILAMAAAKLSKNAATPVVAVEIDALARDNCLGNLQVNQLMDRVQLSAELPEEWQREGFSWVVANILRPVLVEFSPQLVRSMKKDGQLILSGLLAEDISRIENVYLPLLRIKYQAEPKIKIYRKNDWHALHCQPPHL